MPSYKESLVKTKNRLKSVAAISTAVMLTLAGCADNGDDNSDKTPSDSISASTPASTPGETSEETSDAQAISELFTWLYNDISFGEEYNLEGFLVDFSDEDGNPILETREDWDELDQDTRDSLFSKYVENNPLTGFLYPGDLDDFDRLTITASLTVMFTLYNSDIISVTVPEEAVVLTGENNAHIDESKIYTTSDGDVQIAVGLGSREPVLLAVKGADRWLFDLVAFRAAAEEAAKEG